MTPAEKPRDIERKDLLVRVVKKAIKLPIPVANPAIKVNENANNKFESKWDSPHSLSINL